MAFVPWTTLSLVRTLTCKWQSKGLLYLYLAMIFERSDCALVNLVLLLLMRAGRAVEAAC